MLVVRRSIRMNCRFFCVVVVSYHIMLEREREGGLIRASIYLSIYLSTLA